MVAPHYDLNRPAIDILLELIYTTNRVLFFKGHIEFGDPVELDQRPDDDYDANTYIPITVDPLVDDRYRGTTGVMYRRIPLTELEVKSPIIIALDHFPFFPAEVLPLFNKKFGTKLTAEDIDNTEYDDPNKKFVLRTKNSVVYFGERETEVLFGNVDLVHLLNVVKLPGFGIKAKVNLVTALFNKNLPGFESYPHPELVMKTDLSGFREYVG